jgi:hypothetical protein
MDVGMAVAAFNTYVPEGPFSLFPVTSGAWLCGVGALQREGIPVMLLKSVRKGGKPF